MEDLSKFKHLDQEAGYCGGRVKVKNTRMRPINVVASYLSMGEERFKETWNYLSDEMIDECFVYMKKKRP